eukprot:TRINITY_DN2512_c0_g1_i10.p1 TRINITY_DN2512_c0_g1~~TRINITY_DN2512_c0_g1_i10.p1  ORF type:complete len:308 (+),score=89.91 TRINITY_DN2512_c0_g1_i10:451-1374(+)
MGQGCTIASAIVDDQITVHSTLPVGMMHVENALARLHTLRSRILERIKTNKLEVALDFPEVMKAYGYHHIDDIFQDEDTYFSLLSRDLMHDISSRIELVAGSWISSNAERDAPHPSTMLYHPAVRFPQSPPSPPLPKKKSIFSMFNEIFRKSPKDLPSDQDPNVLPKREYSSDLHPTRSATPHTHLPIYEEVTLQENQSVRIRLGIDRFLFSEGYFQPKMIGIASLGICEWIDNFIKDQDDAHRDQLWKNIVICGGASRIPNMPLRIEKDLKKMHPSQVINVKLHPHGGEAAFMGACLKDPQEKVPS